MSFIAAGNPIGAIAQLGDGSTDKYVRARLFDSSSNELPGSPLALTQIANGLYMDSSLSMPSTTPYVLIQSQSFDDSGFTEPSNDYIVSQVFSTSESDGGGVQINQPLPIMAQLGDGNNSLYIQGIVYLPDATIFATVACTLIENGLYQNNSVLMPDVPFVVVQMASYLDPAFTMASGDLLSSVLFSNLGANPNPLPMCPDPSPTIIGFKAYFVRDFPYGNTAASVMDSDIGRAITQATCYLNPNLFCDTGSYNLNILLLSAHFLTLNLRAASQGIAGQYNWLQTSKSVGSVAAAYGIPQRVLDNPELSMFCQTSYGAQVLFNVLPSLTGQVFTACTYTNP